MENNRICGTLSELLEKLLYLVWQYKFRKAAYLKAGNRILKKQKEALKKGKNQSPGVL